ncbi:MAG TPA: hypothetical protein VIK14_03815 [Ignavibacteria bacterium]
MSRPREQIFLFDSKGKKIDIDKLVKEYRTDNKRILADDEVGIILYVADLDLFSYKQLEDGNYLLQKVNEISSPRFPTKLIRRQIGSVVCTISADTIFTIRDKDIIKKIRADKLKKGMILSTGEKIYL